MWPFNKKPRCKLTHFKKFGEKMPENMREIFRFSPYKKDTIGYGIYECASCGKRAFTCIGLHMMGPQTSGVVDDFILHRIDQEVFVEFLQREMAWHELKHPSPEKGGGDET